MADKSLFPRLKRLFSNDVIIRNIGGNQIKVVDTQRIQANGSLETNELIDRFTKIHKYGYNNGFNNTENYQTLRIQLYTDYEAMDTHPIIASVLDIISEESSLKNEMGEILQIRSNNENIQKILYNLFYDVLNIEFNLAMWVRGLVKYGDFYLKLSIAEKFGVYNAVPLSVYDVVREEGKNPDNPHEVRFKIDSVYNAGAVSQRKDSNMRENYEIAHFRLLGDPNFLPYGRSYIEPARKLYKQLTLCEDAMLIHRIMRAPEKRIFYINVGNIPPAEVDAFMQKTINKMRKTPYVDPQTGDYNLKFNMQNITEDFFIPVRGNDTTTKIDTTKGLEYAAIEDVQYLRESLFASLKVPKAFLGFEKDLEGKSTLAAQDMRFARTIDKIQRIILSELYKIAIVHLYVQGFEDAELVNFELGFSSPSTIYEQEKVALYKEKVDLAKQMLETNLFSSDFIQDNIFKLSDDQINLERDRIIEDKKRTFRLSQIEQEGNDPQESGESYGTPHDLATAYGKGRNGEVPTGYDEKKVSVGRPTTQVSNYGTEKSSFGRDPIGKQSLKSIETPLNITLESLKKSKFKKSKKIITEKKSILDETNIKG